MEKEKRKNNEPMPLYIKLILVGLIMVIAFFVLAILKGAWHVGYLRENARSLVQEAIREQCQLADYAAHGSFNDPNDYPVSYYDTVAESGLQIDCDFNGGWQCSCTEQE
jgi:hypothetical protein